MDLNRFIAERLMGWTKARPEIDLGDGFEYWDGGIYSAADWAPDTDIAQAFEVVERMRELGYCYQISAADSGKTRVSFWKSEYDAHGVADENLPTAICFAAKAALEEEA